ncbi:MAG: thioredoxin reductase, partial [Candidatus Proteinoplasmatales archaeon SG8-5]
KGVTGGMAATSPWIENYPGFKGISGLDLMDKMREQAEDNLDIRQGADVSGVEESGGRFSVSVGEEIMICQAIVFATGAIYRKLGIPGESELTGRGVSYCATCDGTFFKGRRVYVIGGGNNGATEALHLKHMGADVTLIHRRDTLRAEKYLQDQMAENGVELLMNSTVKRIVGDAKVESIEVQNTGDGTTRQQDADGIFISIGEEPNTALAKQLGVELAYDGYIEVDRFMRTNIRKVYAAGDVTGGLRQVVTACAEGAIAAMSAYEDIKTPYWV